MLEVIGGVPLLIGSRIALNSVKFLTRQCFLTGDTAVLIGKVTSSHELPHAKSKCVEMKI